MRVVRILAPNPGVFTGPGTNTYLLVSEDEGLIVDPGPVIQAHREAIEAELVDLQPRGVLVTHTHPDHAPLANPLGSGLGVPVYGYEAGSSFDPDRTLRDGERIPVGTEELKVLHTPGHSGDHLCFSVGEALFSGDHIMGGSTVVVEDMTSYLQSLDRLSQESLAVIYPGHGDEMADAQAVIRSYIEHRLTREQQVLTAVRSGASTVPAIVSQVYADIEESLHPLAAISVRAHLQKLASEGLVSLSAEGEALPLPTEEGPLGG